MCHETCHDSNSTLYPVNVELDSINSKSCEPQRKDHDHVDCQLTCATSVDDGYESCCQTHDL